MMASSRTQVSGSTTTMTTLIAVSSSLLLLVLLILSSYVISPVTSFLLPRQQQWIHPPRSAIFWTSPISSAIDGRHYYHPPLVKSSMMYQSLNSQDGEATVTTAAGTSKRSQRKAAQRVKKERLAKQTQSSNNKNKVTSQHPEAILKRQKLQSGGSNVSHTSNKRRNHNFAQRAEYLSGGNDTGFETNELDSLTLLTTTHTHHPDTNTNNNTGGNNNNIQYHQLHSQHVSKLDASTKPDDVVKAIKRAQNLHDEHDIVEIAHFLLEEVGESSFFLSSHTHTHMVIDELFALFYLLLFDDYYLS